MNVFIIDILMYDSENGFVFLVYLNIYFFDIKIIVVFMYDYEFYVSNVLKFGV